MTHVLDGQVTTRRKAAGSLVNYRAKLEFSAPGRLFGPLLLPRVKKPDDSAAQLSQVLDARAAA